MLTSENAQELFGYLTSLSDKFRPMTEVSEIIGDEIVLIFTFQDRDVMGKDMIIHLLNNENGCLTLLHKRMVDKSTKYIFSDINIYRQKLVLKFKKISALSSNRAIKSSGG